MYGIGIYDIVIILISSFFAAGGYRLAKEKGRKPLLWAIMSFFLPFTLPLLIFLKSINKASDTPSFEKIDDINNI